MAEHLTVQALRRRLANASSIKEDAFLIVSSLAAYLGDPRTEIRAQELILRALEHRNAFGPARPVLEALVRQTGLFPYLEPKGLSLADHIAYEFHRPANMEDDEVVFHRVQAQVYDHLLNGENVVLSAPTSFGKSLIIDAIVASGKFKNIAVVVPTIALIDETRRRLTARFSTTYKIITHGGQQRTVRNILVMTQERILELEALEPIEFFVIDEFYKLQPRQEDTERSLLLNEAFYRLFKTGAQFYLLGPNIKDLPDQLPGQLEFKFIRTDYKTVASEVHHVKADGNEDQALVRLCSGFTDPTLVYCSSPARVRKVAQALLAGGIDAGSAELAPAVDWIGGEYDPEWLFPVALRSGIGMHHGRLPRTLSQFVVRAFNNGLIRFLICTSTLIEGVNTKAKNVVIFDNKIAKRKFDYFTYNNILGRSGRMFQHFVGHVYLFHEPPAEELPFVDIPVFTQPDNVPTSLLMQIDDADLVPAARERLAEVMDQNELEVDILRKGKGIDPQRQIELARRLRAKPRAYWPLLNWTRYPTWEQLEAVSKIIWDILTEGRPRSGVFTAKQLAYRIDQLRRRKGAQGLIKLAIEERGETTRDEAVDDAMDFLRNWASFAFPRYLMAIDRIQRSVFARLHLRPGDYAFFAGQVENWFVDPALMALDEYGIPIQVGQKLADVLRPEGDLDAVLARLRRLDIDRLPLSSFEKALVSDAKNYL